MGKGARPYEQLAYSIIIRAFRDLVDADEIRAIDALAWIILSPDCEYLCQSLGLEKRPLELILEGAYPTRFPRLKTVHLDDFDFQRGGESTPNE